MDACVIGVTNNLLFEQMIRDDRDRSLFWYDEIIFSPYDAATYCAILRNSCIDGVSRGRTRRGSGAAN